MDELGKAIRDLIITAGIVILILFGVVVYFSVKEITPTRKVRQLEPGDTFKVECVTENPYDNQILFGGTIISKNGNYIQYVNKYGDTTSTNIRDVYASPKVFKITVTKPNENGK